MACERAPGARGLRATSRTKKLGPEYVSTFLEPWATMPDPEGRWREVDEMVMGMHSQPRSSEMHSAGYYQVLVERHEWSPDAELLLGSIWSPAGKPLATAHLTTRVTG